ncbi:MAG: anti-anti-sigma factor [Chlamydiae bacterium RIFCSPHIGHO2_12_FULL_44_59]|nr:MAG: anti-anti-sigma factor [Chlamydiae bacterium RIFCSPHIGHO2_01_FULL_44_39]OGN58512.1 MAG: anti-anti-sigma factor [Chlamydiae bacterium RIFCSPHIGHO2_02_FULL_45_9]OGN59730.1 MAG: anti-anti-sigma factor [Chlamydiae bacterium RIFCSPHIGHO2_12_FULL_44_59]OGN65813.1 MAG: anti-anti-sigma factor [Chlamydiae bacterium RIFCSPLOWO2_01_FULL_44_52]OGN67990.1 MAG: anti-anti-sigma factor [Chlamydiae bacterium RIFCSPLOWO2_02_FULL_45_22]OGN69545.1 MAG: anti-anti-sigma factor [Chlamydiae bacterium RIFCSPLO
MGVGLRIELEEVEQRVILRIDGRIDAASAPILDRKINSLIDEQHTHLILDFTRTDYLSSAGMRVLLSAIKKLKPQKGGVVLFGASEEVLEVIRMAGFDKIFRIYSSEKEALQHQSPSK